jgi:hypothetical protein
MSEMSPPVNGQSPNRIISCVRSWISGAIAIAWISIVSEEESRKNERAYECDLYSISLCFALENNSFTAEITGCATVHGQRPPRTHIKRLNKKFYSMSSTRLCGNVEASPSQSMLSDTKLSRKQKDQR